MYSQGNYSKPLASMEATNSNVLYTGGEDEVDELFSSVGVSIPIDTDSLLGGRMDAYITPSQKQQQLRQSILEPTAYSSSSSGSNTQTTGISGNNSTFQDTLDEPVSVTIMRDLKNIGEKMRHVIIPNKDNKNILRDWDLWGPLLLCLVLSIRLSLTAPKNQTAMVFTGVFVIVWVGAGVVTVNSQLLGGKLSFFQSICVLGYCILPLVLASIVSLFIPSALIRIILSIGAFGWSTYASHGFLSDVGGLANRKVLAVYPMFLFYFILAWLILISKSVIE